MKKFKLLSLVLLLFFAAFMMVWALPEPEKFERELIVEEPLNPDEGSEAFDKMMQVLTHKRCVNCHPAGDRPRQGEDSHYHNFGVKRGLDNHGVAALRCEGCHGHENNDFSGVPGAPEWSLAPLKMQWEGLTRVEIAKSMLNRENNGNRSLDEIVKHLTEHELVLWAWEPGIDADGNPRELPPVPVDEYIQAVKDWAAAGAVIPAE
ncbi:MAG: hypothetical protein AAF696_19990 [Bacteroidota bacterium]